MEKTPTAEDLPIGELLPYATPTQAKVLQAIVRHGGTRKAAVALGVNRRNIQRAVERVREAAARKDPSQHVASAPAGYHLRGVSTLVNASGETVMQWQKTARDPLNPGSILDAFREAIEDEPIPAVKRSAKVKGTDPDRMVVYPMGDPHLGMYAWHEECGTDYDLEIGERNLCAAVDHLVDLAPQTRDAAIINLGDMLHADNQAGVTSRSGHVLDMDSRWQKVMRTAIRVMHRSVDRALTKHAKVFVHNLIGNHDDLSSMMLALALAERYRNEPRVEVDTSPAVFRYREFGANLLGMTHHPRPKGLAGIMAADQPEAWGRTKHRRWYTGHIHQERVYEDCGVIVEAFRTLAGKEAYAAAAGYRSGRSMVCDVLHKDHGRVLRHEVGIDALEGQR